MFNSPNDFRFVRSPSQPTQNSPNYSTINSILIAKTSTNDISGKRLNFDSMTQSQFLNESMIQPSRTDIPQPGVTIKGNYNVKESLVAMDRLQNISKNFLNFFGNGGTIPKERMADMLGLAHQRSSQGQPEMSRENLEGLFSVYDGNRDGRISIEDIVLLASRYLSYENKKIVYTRHVQEKLDVARRLFKMFDTHKRGYLTEKEVPYLLNETYKALGKNDFIATQEDVKSWMMITDEDKDGKVRLEEYQTSIIRSLRKQGVKIYDE